MPGRAATVCIAPAWVRFAAAIAARIVLSGRDHQSRSRSSIVARSLSARTPFTRAASAPADSAS